jgi:eukaryotic-like serine/threonine-protein kinase
VAGLASATAGLTGRADRHGATDHRSRPTTEQSVGRRWAWLAVPAVALVAWGAFALGSVMTSTPASPAARPTSPSPAAPSGTPTAAPSTSRPTAATTTSTTATPSRTATKAAATKQTITEQQPAHAGKGKGKGKAK